MNFHGQMRTRTWISQLLVQHSSHYTTLALTLTKMTSAHGYVHCPCISRIILQQKHCVGGLMMMMMMVMMMILHFCTSTVAKALWAVYMSLLWPKLSGWRHVCGTQRKEAGCALCSVQLHITGMPAGGTGRTTVQLFPRHRPLSC